MEATPKIPDFELLRRIGGGSYGVVWLGRSVTGVYRAVKIVDRARFADSRPFLREFDGIRRFQKAVGGQARQLALLHVGFDESAGTLFYVMELADDALAGSDIDPATYVPLTLKELRLRRAQPMSPSECVRIGVELAGALEGLHEAGLIHRDVKPSNIIFVNGIPKLADVGLIASTEQTLTSLGTLGYAPPEGSGTVRADLYSLGKILYELVTGLGPGDFPRLPMEVIAEHGSAAVLELNEVILRACDPDPNQRYANTRALLDDLLLLQAGRSVQELNRTKRRFKLLLKASALFACVGIVALAGLGINNYRTLQKVAAQEIAFRKQAETNEQLAQYTADFHLARLALSTGDFGATRTALRRQIPVKGRGDLRGFEWHALWNDTAGNASFLLGEIGGPVISSLALSPDGRRLAVQEGIRPQNTVLWDLTTRQRTLLAEDTFRLGGFSADGSKLIVGTPNRKVRTIDMSTGQSSPDQPVVGRLLQGLGDGRTVLLSEQQQPSGSRLIIWDAVSQTQIAEWQPEPRTYNISLSAAALSPDRRLLASNFFWAEGAVRKRELIVYDLVERVEKFRTTSIDGIVQWLKFSPDSQWLVATVFGNPIVVYSAKTGAEAWRLTGHQGGVLTAEFSPGSRLLASGGSDQTLRVWDLNTGLLTSAMRGHESDIMTLAWQGDGAGLVTGGQDGTCRIWPFPAKEAQVVSGLWNNTMGDFVFSPDGKTIVATGHNGQVDVLDAQSLEKVRSIPGAFQPLLFEKDGGTLLALSVDQTLVRSDLATGESQPLSLKLSVPEKWASVEVSEKYGMAAFGFEKGKIELWNLTEEKSLGASQPDAGLILALGWAPDRLQLAVGDQGGLLKIKSIDSNALEEISFPPNTPIKSVAYSPDGKLLAIGVQDGRVFLRDFQTGKLSAPLEGHSTAVLCLAFSPDGSRLVTSGTDGLIIFWSLTPLRQIAIWALDDNLHVGAQRAICRLKFDHTGQRIGAMTEDGRLRIWSASH